MPARTTHARISKLLAVHVLVVITRKAAGLPSEPSSSIHGDPAPPSRAFQSQPVLRNFYVFDPGGLQTPSGVNEMCLGDDREEHVILRQHRRRPMFAEYLIF